MTLIPPPDYAEDVLFSRRSDLLARATNRYSVMPEELNTKANPDQPVVYQIRIRGHLGPQWRAWFRGLTITQEAEGETLLTGPVVDQAALHGMLRKVRDLGMPLISVIALDNGRRKVSDIK